ncbi:MAG TPA: hypothetical protein PL041_07640 [Melioribacteraceae bacterium]|nr:hypothetical protein [Melioribacteraceae bacterium]
MSKPILNSILIITFLNFTFGCTASKPVKLNPFNLDESHNNVINLSINDSLYSFINKDAICYKLPNSIEGYNTKNFFLSVPIDSIKSVIEPNVLIKDIDSSITIKKLVLLNNNEIIFNSEGGKLVDNNYLIKGTLSDSSSFSVKTNQFDYLTINKLDVTGTIVKNLFLVGGILLGAFLILGIVIGKELS